MRKLMVLFLLIFCTLLIAHPDFAMAHGTGHRMITDGTAVTVEFFLLGL
jgi:hypothetical protein